MRSSDKMEILLPSKADPPRAFPPPQQGGTPREHPMATPIGKVLSVNVGTPREFEYGGRPAKSAIWKSPAVGRIAARGVNLDGDEQADREVHGGPDKAVYAYAIEDIRWWEKELGRSLEYGELGQNLTTQGIDVNNGWLESVGRSGPLFLRFPSRGYLAGGLAFGCRTSCFRAALARRFDRVLTCG
jgi:hypothetical protein